MQSIPSEMKDSGAVEIHRKLGEISGGRVLDVATSSGSFIGLMKSALRDYHSFVGIDVSEEELGKARQKFEGELVEFIKMDAENMTFDDHSFDTVAVSFSLHHLRNIKQVLAETKRVLKPGGHLILQEMISDGKQSESQKTDTLIHHWNAEVDSLLGIPHFKTLKRERLIALVDGLDLENLEVFEATRYVQCFYCDKSAECSDPHSKTAVDEASDDINRILERAQETPKYEKHLEKAERLRKRLALTGYSPASIMFFIGRQKSLG